MSAVGAGKEYYYNARTQETSWTRPAVAPAAAAPPAVAPAAAPAPAAEPTQPPAHSPRPDTGALIAHAQRLRYRGETNAGTAAPLVETWSATQKRDADGEEVVRQLAAALRESGQFFTDETFSDTNQFKCVKNCVVRAGCEMNSAQVGVLQAGKEVAVLETRGDRVRTEYGWLSKRTSAGVRCLEQRRKGGVKWLRPSEFAPGRKPVVFSDGSSPEDITQGRLGNCYFLAALATLATEKGGALIDDLVIEDGHDVGLYGVKFHVNGSWVTVVVDDRFPCRYERWPDGVPKPEGAPDGVWSPVYAHSDPHDGSPGDELE